MSLIIRKRLPLAAAILSFALNGCLFDTKSPAPETPAGRVHAGAGLDSIRVAATAVLAGGTLYVADRDPEASGIVGVDVSTDAVTSFYPEALAPNDLALAGDSQIVISESDYTNGSLSLLDLRSGKLTASYRSIDPDNSVSSSGDSVFLMERTLGVVTGFTGGTLEEGKVFLNAQAGKGSNPHQLVLAGGRAFVTRYDFPSLLILDPAQVNGGTRDSLDLSPWNADSAQTPGMDAAAAYQGNIYVTLQRLSGYVAKDTSKVLVVDAATGKVTKEIPLLYRNPLAAKALGKYLYVACVDGYGTYTGGVERIDMEKGESAGSVVTEDSLQGDITGFIPVSDTKGYVLFASPDFKKTTIRPVSM